MAILYAYLFVFGVIGLSEGLRKLGILTGEGGRKFIHIGVGNWMIIAPFVFDTMWMALIPPFTFIVLNYISYRYDLIKSMERADKTSNDLGTVYYAISLFVVVLLDYLLFGEFKLSVLPILILAYGDGFSAIVGMTFPSKTLVGNKTLYGTITMLVLTLVVAYIYLSNIWIVLIVGVVATILELFTPKGFDNLSVPIGVYLLLFLL